MKFPRFFSMDNPKAIKAQKLGWLNGINYMAPHRLAQVGDLCGNSTVACRALCLGEHSGNAALYPAVMDSRIRKAQWFMTDRKAFLQEAKLHIKNAKRQARKAKLKLCLRMNGSTDLAWEGLAPEIFVDNPTIQFVDYTKSVKRALAYAAGKMPSNYHLTFSHSEKNELDCRRVLAAGGNVAVVFGCPMPKTYLGYPVVNGDESDLRHLDKRHVIVGLSPKGLKAKRDSSGFVVWSVDLTMAEYFSSAA
jgi:hypothetical protein